MKKFLITTDSGCDLPRSEVDKRGIIPFLMQYEIDGEVFTDTMLPEDLHAFYEKMRAGAAPRTSQINPAQFVEFWRPLLAEGLPILHTGIGSAVSGTYRNACLAAEELMQEIPGAKIYVVDSTLCSVGYGMLVLKAAELRDGGASVEEARDYMEANKAKVNTWYTTDELKYLRRSGRCSRASAAIGTMLQICPILNLDLEGHLIVQERVRKLGPTIQRIHEIIGGLVEDAENQTLMICHSDVEEKARKFGEEIREKFGFRDVYYTYIGATIGANCGPGLMAAFFFGKPRTMKGYAEGE